MDVELNFKSVETLTPCDHVEFRISQHRNLLFFLLTTLSNCRAHTPLCLVMSISSLFTVLTPTPLSLLISPLCVLSSVFVHVRCTHTPHLQAVLTNYPQAYIVSLCIHNPCSLYSHTHTLSFLQCVLLSFAHVR